MSQTPASPPEDEELRGQLETLLFITDHPLTLEDLRKLTKVKDTSRLGALVEQVRLRLEEGRSPLQVLEIGGGFQMATRPAYGDLVRKLFAEKMTLRLSTAAHETLAIIAYKQPLTRAEIEEIRGVEVIAALETLLEKRLIKVVGRKESVGRPLLYGTTADFMRHFGLRSLEDLPPIDSFQPAEPVAPAASEAAPAAEPAVEPAVEPAAEPAAEPAVEAAVEPEAAAVAAPVLEEAPAVAPSPEPPAPAEPARPIWPGDEDEQAAPER